MNHIPFHNIEQFRHCVKTVRERGNYHSVPLPILQFNGSVKLHGTNAAIVKDFSNNEIWYQSRSSIITPNNDNAGFAKFSEERKEIFRSVFNFILPSFIGDEIVSIYGEWCGQGIQKGVGITQLPKMFIIFDIRIQRGDEHIWLKPSELEMIGEYFHANSRIYSFYFIQNFQTELIEIDFSKPELSQNKLVELTNQVEKECPVAKEFGIEGIGEGIVWRCISDWDGIKTSDLIFKVKGEKHSDTKVKKLASIDIERVNSINEFVSNVLTEHRLEKMVDLLKQDGHPLEPQSIPIFLKLVGQDIIKEESDSMESNGFERKEIMPAISKSARQYFLNLINKL